MTEREVSIWTHLANATLVLVVNVSLTIWGLSRYGVMNNSFEVYGYTDSAACTTVRRLDSVLHWIINVLSTLLLGSSNYCAQILVAPTREEVDKAHREDKWCDIDTPSTHNLRRIARRRKVIWFCLMSSSALLHLFWNSAVSSAILVNTYSFAFVTDDFRSDTQPWACADSRIEALRNKSALGRLDKPACIQRYMDGYIGQNDLLVVSANVSMSVRGSIGINNSIFAVQWQKHGPEGRQFKKVASHYYSMHGLDNGRRLAHSQ